MNRAFIGRIIIKAALLFALVNFVFALLNPLTLFDHLSLYNTLLPGRARLPYAENPSESYNVTLTRLESMFAAHEISGAAKQNDEYRVVVLGDSAVWGWLLGADETLSACMNAQNLSVNGKQIRVFNLGYPVLDVTKDLLILDYALTYEPDMVVWFVTLAALYPDEQLFHEVVRAHPEEVRALISRYDLALNANELPLPLTFWERTLIGQRRELALWLNHQVYGIAWAATGIDHRNPEFFTPVRVNLRGGTSMLDGTTEKTWTRSDLSLDVIAAGVSMANDAGVEMLLINEPIFQSSGENSDLRYNFYYPRWAFDGYRALMDTVAMQEGWQYVDLWDAAPNDQFTDSSLHLTPEASCAFAERVEAEIQAHAQ